MAMSGSFSTDAYSNRTCVFNWSASNNGNRTATINWSITGGGSATGYYLSGPVYSWANGSQILNRTDRFQLWQGTVVGSGSFTIGYNNAGDANFAASVNAAIYSSTINVSSGDVTQYLDNIGYIAPSNVSVSIASTNRTGFTLSRSWTNASECQYNIGGQGWQAEGSTMNGIYCNRNTVSGLQPNKAYTVQIRFINVNSAWVNSNIVTGTTTGNAPTINSVSLVPSRTSSVLTPNVSYDTNASYSAITVQYGTTTSYGSTSTSSTISGLQPNTKYYYSMTVKDNWNRISSAYTGEFTTTGNVPVINSVTPVLGRTQCELGANIVYDTKASFKSVLIQYGLTTSYGSTSNNFIITELQPNTTYYYRMVVTDNWNRASTSFTSNIKTIANPPIFNTEEIIDVGVESAQLRFIAEPDLNTSIDEYRLYDDNNVLINISTDGLFDIIDLEEDTSYSYYCVVYDNIGNNRQSNILSFRTLTSKFVHKINENGNTTEHNIYSIGEPKNFIRHIKLENGGIAFLVNRDYATACSYSSSTTSMRSELISIQHTTLNKYQALFIKSNFAWKLQYYNKNKIGVTQTTGGPGEGALITFSDIEGYYAIEINTLDIDALKEETQLWACQSSDLEACMNDTYKIKKRLQKTDIVKVSNKMRYIDIGQNGNYIDETSKIVELEVYDNNGVNVALHKPVIIKSGKTYSDIEKITNGNTATTDYCNITGRRTIAQVDLGQEYEVDYIRLWRYYQDNRYYKETFLYGHRGSKNLFNFKKWLKNSFPTVGGTSTIDNDGNITITSTSTDCNTDTYSGHTDKERNKTAIEKYGFEVKPNTTYTFSANQNGGGNPQLFIFLNDADYTYNGAASIRGSASAGIISVSITTKNTTKYMTVRLDNDANGTSLIYDSLQVEEGNSCTEYQSGDAKELCYKFHDWKRDGEYPETSSGLYVKVDNAPIDTGVPVINSFTANTLNWTNQGVILTILAQDDFGTEDLIYSFDGGINWTKKNYITVFKNDVYTAIARDKAGNFSTTNPTINITNIDLVPPTQPFIQLRYDNLNGELYDGNWTNRNICVDIKTTDSTNKCPNDMEPGYIDKDTGLDTSDNDKMRLDSDIKFTQTNNQIYVGRYGNITGVATIYFYDGNDLYLGYVNMPADTKDNIIDVPVDAEYARLSDTVMDLTNYYMVAEENTAVPYEPYYVVYDNLSGIKGWYYKISPNSTDYLPILPGTIINQNSNFKWYVVTRDNAGNNSMATDIEVKIDVELPVNPRFGYTKTSTSLTLTASGTDDFSGIRGYSFSIDNGQTWTDEQTSNIYTFNNLDGMYNVVIKIIDMAGNEAISDFQAINVGTNRDFPVITGVTGNPVNWTKDDVTLTITAVIGSGSAPGITIEQYSFDNGRTWSTSNQATFNNNTFVHMMVKDSNGKTSETYLSDIIMIDKIPPSLTIPTEEVTISFGVDYDLIRGVTYYDNESGIDEGSLVINPSSTVAFSIGENTITYTISDIVGNSTTKTRIINVEGLVPSDDLYPRDDLYPEDLPY